MFKFNLQLFAEPNTNTTAQTGAGQEILSVQMKDYYDTEIIRNAEPMLVHDKFGQKKPIPKNKGKTIEFRKLNPFPKATTPLTEGVTPDGRKLDWSKVTATVSQYGDYVTVSDMLEMTALDNNIIEATRVLGDQAGRTLDSVTREIINAGTNVQYGDGTVSTRFAVEDTDVLSVAAVKKAVNTLKNGLAKRKDGSYIAIIHPNAAYDLTSDDEWQNVKDYNPKDWYDGEIGRIHGCRFVETTEAKVFSAADLTAANRTLTVKTTLSAAGKTLSIDEALTAADAAALVGRKILLAGKQYTIKSAVATTGSEAITVADTDPNITTTDGVDGAVIYPGEAGAEGIDIYSTLFIGADAYGVTEISGGGLETIVKQLGSAGTADSLNQRATIGWKATKTAEILTEAFMVRVETASSLG